jgi:hypothetical protein
MVGVCVCARVVCVCGLQAETMMSNPQVGAMMESLSGLAQGMRSGAGSEGGADDDAAPGPNLAGLMAGLMGSTGQGEAGGGGGGFGDVAAALYVDVS